MRKILFLVCFGSSVGLAGVSSIEKAQAFRDLSSEAVVMHIAAHPDDEDGATIAYIRRHVGAKVYTVFLTRGEGGQNEIGAELYDELGVIRTRETREAARILGSIPLFMNFSDFGFSKTASEAFGKWGGPSEVLRRVVYTIRKYKPDVLFTNFNTVSGHGQHQVAGICAITAFDAAADSTMFPEQLRLPGLTLWQPRKVYVRQFGSGKGDVDVVVPIAAIDDLSKKSYLDVAAEALRSHKSQGMDKVDLSRFTRTSNGYNLVRQNSVYLPDSTSFFGGIDLWRGFKNSAFLDLKDFIRSFMPDMKVDTVLHRVSIAQEMIRALPSPATPFESRVVAEWKNELVSLVLAVSGVHCELSLADSVVIRNQDVVCTIQIFPEENSNLSISDVRTRVTSALGWTINERPGVAPVVTPTRHERDFLLRVGGNAFYTIPRATYQYAPVEWNQDINADVSLRLSGFPLTLYSSLSPDIAPEQVMKVTPSIVWIEPSREKRGVDLEVEVRNFLRKSMTGTASATVPDGWKSTQGKFSITDEDGVARMKISVTPPSGVYEGEYRVRVKAEYSFEDVRIKVQRVSVANDIEVGLVTSFDNTIETVLQGLGVSYQLLNDKFLENLDLLQFTSIVVDIRAYLVRDDLQKFNSRLLKYVHDGGNLIVFYQKDQEWKESYAPFPFSLSRDRVTNENAPIEILNGGHPLFTKPNLIGNSAWEGWVQERGLYFPTNVPQEYERMLSSNDPDEEPLTTGYLVASYGKGSYIYTSYVWYRQMKEAHPGAIGCFANMISYPRYRAK